MTTPSPISDQAAGEPNWSHPKLQALLSRNARMSLQLGIIEELIDDLECEYDTDGDYASAVTDKVHAFVKASRSTAPTTGSSPVASDIPCPICNGVEGCDHTVPERSRATRDAHTQLMKFYAVETTDALIAEMERHIQKLQSKLPQYRDPINQRVREG